MPYKNTSRDYKEKSVYHVYNLSANDSPVFLDKKDYDVFLSFLKYALLPEDDLKGLREFQSEYYDTKRVNIRRQNFHGRIELLAYCLMPNHYHLLLYQEDEKAISDLMKSVITGYVMYFNKRHNRSGNLFQARYRSSIVLPESNWKLASRYIHTIPLTIGRDYKDYEHSSCQAYTNKKDLKWLNNNLILRQFDANKEYEKYLDNYAKLKQQQERLEINLADH